MQDLGVYENRGMYFLGVPLRDSTLGDKGVPLFWEMPIS